ncbi:MFS transporter [Lysinibacillus sphaericus]
MTTFLLIIIYLAFISLGLPDSILGAAWPVMQKDLGAPLESAGLLFMTVAGGTIISSLVSGTILKRFGTGKVTFVSCLMTAIALAGFQFSPSVLWLVVCAVPLGLGAGAVDSGLNNYVAAHYKAHHMSWLHSFWGVGATMGPVIMAHFIAGDFSWRSGYLAIAGIQLALAILLLVTLPIWGKVKNDSKAEENASQQATLNEEPKAGRPLQVKGVKLALFTFFFYCSIEAAMGLWGSSFLVNAKGISPADAARWVSLYWGGITAGRFITGFITFKVSNLLLIRWGQLIALCGAVLLFMPLPTVFSLIGFMLVGLGLAPIFPCMLHETPARFGKHHSQSIMGFQMAFAYTGSTFMPPLFGFIASKTSIGFFPVFTLVMAAVMLLSSERLNSLLKKNSLEKEIKAV